MADIKQKIAATFGKLPKVPPMPPAPPPPVKEPPKPSKGIADISVAIEAQRIYSPDRPPAPPSKGPSKDMLGQGSAPAMDQSGPWGKPK